MARFNYSPFNLGVGSMVKMPETVDIMDVIGQGVTRQRQEALLEEQLQQAEEKKRNRGIMEQLRSQITPEMAASDIESQIAPALLEMGDVENYLQLRNRQEARDSQRVKQEMGTQEDIMRLIEKQTSMSADNPRAAKAIYDQGARTIGPRMDLPGFDPGLLKRESSSESEPKVQVEILAKDGSLRPGQKVSLPLSQAAKLIDSQKARPVESRRPSLMDLFGDMQGESQDVDIPEVKPARKVVGKAR